MKKNKKPLEKFYLDFRQKKDAGLEPLLKLLDKLGLTANLITLFRVILVIASAAMIKFSIYISFWMFVLVYILDGLDGSLARYQKKADKKGAMFDIISDQFTVVGLLLGLIIFRKVEVLGAAVYLVLFVSLVCFYLRSKDLDNIPYFYNKFWIIAFSTLWVFTGVNLIDTALIGLNVYLFILLAFDVYSLIKAQK